MWSLLVEYPLDAARGTGAATIAWQTWPAFAHDTSAMRLEIDHTGAPER
jgi:hypothetical protein